MFTTTNLNPMESHNPTCDIMCGYIGNDTLITYVLSVTGNEAMEIYQGPNYLPYSKLKNWSRHYTISEIPNKWKKHWNELKTIYENNYSRK